MKLRHVSDTLRLTLCLTGCAVLSCSSDSGDTEVDPCNIERADQAPSCDVTVNTSADDQTAVQTALIEAQEGDTVCFGSGTFSFTDELSLNVKSVTLRGKSDGSTIFDFTSQETGANGVRIMSDDVTVLDLTVQNTPGDGIRVEATTGITFRRTKVLWDGEPDLTNGAYGLYPVGCSNVLIDACEVKGARDAGIYVGQSNHIVVKNSHAHGNVAGIEIENSRNAEVFDNEADDNVGGILVFDLPGLPSGNGGDTRVHDNNSHDNNRAQFAMEGTTVSYVPTGTGIMLLAADRIEIDHNTVTDNETAGVLIIAYAAVEAIGAGNMETPDPDYDSYPESAYIHDNTFTNNGTSPQGVALIITPTPLDDILWDGLVNSEVDMTSEALRFCIQNNRKGDGSDATFRNFHLDVEMTNIGEPEYDLSPYDCTHESQAAVTCEAAEASP